MDYFLYGAVALQFVCLLVIIKHVRGMQGASKILDSDQEFHFGNITERINYVQHRFEVLEAKVNQFMKTPVLRQYVERNIPVLMSETQEKQLQENMAKRKDEWAEAHGDGTSVASSEAPFKRQKYPDRAGGMFTSPDGLV